MCLNRRKNSVIERLTGFNKSLQLTISLIKHQENEVVDG